MLKSIDFKKDVLKSLAIVFFLIGALSVALYALNAICGRLTGYMLSPIPLLVIIQAGDACALLTGALCVALLVRALIRSPKLTFGWRIATGTAVGIVGIVLVCYLSGLLFFFSLFASKGTGTLCAKGDDLYYYYNAGWIDPEFRYYKYVNPLVMESKYFSDTTGPTKSEMIVN